MKKAAAVLKNVAILEDLSDSELEEVFRISKRLDIPSGDVLMTEGEVGTTMFFFVEGTVDVSKNLTMKIGKKGFGQAEKSMVKLRAEHVSFFGDMAMFTAEPRSATITAASDCVLYEVAQEDFTAFCDAHPAGGVKVMRRMAKTMSDRIRRGNEDILKLTTALSIALAK